MTSKLSYDVIVIGLGAMGSAATYHLSKAGRRVLALEQFSLGHALGSSYGESRIIRYIYDHPDYVRMAKHTYPVWEAVQADVGRNLLVMTGGLNWGREDNPHLIATKHSLEVSAVPFEWLSPAETCERFPQFRIAPDEKVIYQAESGFLRATDCVVSQATRAAEYGATIRTETPVTEIDLFDDYVAVHTPADSYQAAALVITAGPWAGRVLGKTGLQLPLQPTREILGFFETENRPLFMPDRCPIYIYWGTEKVYYGIADADGQSGFKVAQHGRHEPTDPDTINRITEESYVHELRDFLGRYIPQGAGRLLKGNVCMYTMTPDEHFIIDRHPGYPHVAIGAGFSGHGFKFSTFIGKLLGELATGESASFQSDLFKIARFGK
jgi:monomeric sarcosine oxidase